MSHIIISGGSGLTGRHLIDHLNSLGHHTSYLTRHEDKNVPAETFIWDPYERQIEESAFDNTDVLIHLAGANLNAEKWTDKRKDELYNSRIISTRLLAMHLKERNKKLKTIISGSAVGYYGDSGNTVMIETDRPGKNFLAQLCANWEQEAMAFEEVCDNLIIVRTGLILAENGGALQEILDKVVLGGVAYFGHGKQYYSWIHIDDYVRMITHMIENKWQGVFNAVAPDVVTNKRFIAAIKEASGEIFYFLPVPVFVLKLFLGEMASTVMETSRCSSEKVEKNGFRFDFPTIKAAMNDLI